MKVHVVSDDQGRIISLGIPGDVRGVSGIGKAGVMPRAGQKTYMLEVPHEYRDHTLLDLHRTLRVEVAGNKARLVSAEHFTEPYLKPE